MIAITRLPRRCRLSAHIVRLIAAVLFIPTLMCDRGFLVKHVFYRMDTVVEVTVVMEKKEPDREALLWQRLDTMFARWEQRFSQTDPLSEILHINRRSSSKMLVSPEMSRMIGLALRYGDTLSGGFDLTIFPLKELWGLGERDTALTIPSRSRLDSTLRHVSYEKVHLNVLADSVIIDDPETKIDLGGIAKGEALCRASGLLIDSGYKNFLVNGGGDIVSRGKRPDGKAWFIGLQHPRDARKLLAALPLDSGCIYTSGDYERFYLRDGKRYHHIFDPKTGYSSTKNQSVTIWDMDPREAKMFSTGLYNRPAAAIVAFIEKRPRAQCIVVDSTGTIFTSSGWKNRIEWR